MATNLLCIDDQCFVHPTAGDKATSLPKAVNRVASGSEVEGHLASYWGGTGNILNRTVTASGLAENQSYYFGRFTSKPLAAQTFPAQSWNWNVIVGEGATQANTFIWPVMYVWRPSNNTVVGYIFDASAPAGSEIPATPTGGTRNFAGASVTCLEDDLLVVEAWMSGTPSAAAHLQTWRLTANNSVIVSPYTIAWKPDTILFFQETVPAIVPTAGTKVSPAFLPKANHTNSEKSATEGLLTTTLVQNPLGRTGNALAITGEQSIYWGRHSTPPLAAQTIPAQEWYWGVSCGTQKADAVFFHYPVLYIWRPSTQAVVGWIFDGSVAKGQKWRNGIDPLMSQRFTGAAITTQDGDILCCEVWSVGTQGTAVASAHMVWTTAQNSSLECPYIILPQGAVAPANATLAVTEDPDTISATATVTDPPRTATLTVTEAPDTISATVVVTPLPTRTATLTVTEATDALDADAGSVSIPKIGTLIEDFEAPADPGKWDTTNVLNGTTVFQNGVGEFSVTSTVNGTHASLISVGDFSLKDSAVFWKVVRPTRWTADVGGGEFSLAMEAPGDNRVDWTIYSNGDISIIKFTNNAWGQVAAIDTGYYSKQDTYRWLRTRETAGTTYFESAPSTASNPPLEGDWVVRHSALTNTLPINAGINNVKAVYRVWVSNAAIGAMIQTGQIDGFNTAASAALSPALATLALTEAPDTVSATAKAPAGATLTRTEAPDTIAATAGGTAGATLTRTEAPDTIAATASSGMTANLTRTEAPDTIVATASSPTGANLGITEAGDTVVATAGAVATGTLTLTEAPDTIAATAQVLPFPTITANLDVQEAPDQVASASGSPAAIADLARTEAPDTLVATASSGIGASLARTEAPDAISASARVVAGASLARTEAADSLASSATAPATGNLSKTEFNDTLSSIVRSVVVGALSIQEANDTLASDAIVRSGVEAGLTVTEGPDTLEATATVADPISYANLNVTEAGDTLMGYTHHAKKRVILIT